jgi:hypothetical protein
MNIFWEAIRVREPQHLRFPSENVSGEIFKLLRIVGMESITLVFLYLLSLSVAQKLLLQHFI